MRLLVLVTPSFNMAATMGFLDPFRAANYLDGKPYFRWELASPTGGPLAASNGLTLGTHPLAAVTGEKYDFVLVSASWTPEQYASPQLNAALWRWARQGSVIAGLDTGPFILAGAGLLNGRRATVHYEHIDAFQELFPQVDCCEDLIVIDGARMSCCGGSAATDLALHVIRSAHGDHLANAAARYMFHQSVRPVGTPQNPSLSDPLGRTAPQPVRSAIALMEKHLEEPLTIPALCQLVEISQRQLDRLFVQYVRKSPTQYYRDIRLDRARGLVTQTDMPLAQVAVASGFASQVHFSRAYRTRFGLPPRDDRIEGRVPFEFRAWPMHRKTG